MVYRVEALKTADYGNVRLHSCRLKSVRADWAAASLNVGPACEAQCR